MATDESTPSQLAFEEISHDEYDRLAPVGRTCSVPAERRVVRAVRTGPVCIYGLTEPGEEWNVRYVGKAQQRPGESPTQTIERRLGNHLAEARTHDGSGYRKINWLKRVLSQGQTPGVRLLDIGDAQTWESLERWHIAAHRAAGYDLINETDGGEGVAGYVYSPEQRRAVSVRFKGKKKPPAHHAKLVAHLAQIAAERAAAPCCPKGHPLTPDNLVPLKSGRRRCRICHNARRREQTKRDNERQGRATLPPNYLRTHCPQGHEYTPENTFIGSKGERCCRLCQQQASRRSYEKRFGKTVDGPILPRPELRTHCPYGHEYTPENTYLNPRTGARSCKECRRERNREAYQKGKEAERNGP